MTTNESVSVREGVEALRKQFEGFILNGRMDDPRGGSLRRDQFFEDAYEDPRLTIGWVCWQEAHKQQAEQLKEAQALIASLQAKVPKAEADQNLRMLMRYTEEFYASAIDHGMAAGSTANCVAHVERAAKRLHALAIGKSSTLPSPPNEAKAEAVKEGSAGVSWSCGCLTVEVMCSKLNPSAFNSLYCVDCGHSRECHKGAE